MPSGSAGARRGFTVVTRVPSRSRQSVSLFLNSGRGGGSNAGTSSTWMQASTIASSSLLIVIRYSSRTGSTCNLSTSRSSSFRQHGHLNVV